MDNLAEFFVSHPASFSKKFVQLAKSRPDLLELVRYLVLVLCYCPHLTLRCMQVPSMLPRFSSPNAVLDEDDCFWKLLVGLRNLDDLQDIVNGLVYLSHGLQLSWEKYELEKPELEEKINRIDRMLHNCVMCECLEVDKNLIIAFQNDSMMNRLSSIEVARARALVEGPLSLCFRNENVMSILGTRQVSL